MGGPDAEREPDEGKEKEESEINETLDRLLDFLATYLP